MGFEQVYFASKEMSSLFDCLFQSRFIDGSRSITALIKG